jgi:hypothetical protein
VGVSGLLGADRNQISSRRLKGISDSSTSNRKFFVTPNSHYVCLMSHAANGPSTWWLEGASGTPQMGGLTPGLELKNHTHQFHSKHMVKARLVVMGNGPLCTGG